jgi:hypothetical protein
MAHANQEGFNSASGGQEASQRGFNNGIGSLGSAMEDFFPRRSSGSLKLRSKMP